MRVWMLTTWGAATATRALPMARPWWSHERGLLVHQQIANPTRANATNNGARTSMTGHDHHEHPQPHQAPHASFEEREPLRGERVVRGRVSVGIAGSAVGCRWVGTREQP